MGSQRTTEAGPATMYPPSALQSFGVLTEAADTARSQGDTKIAADLDKAAATHRTRMLAWVMAAQQNLPERGTGH